MKMLINLPVVSREGVAIPWLLKFQKFEEKGFEIYLNGGEFIKKIHLVGTDVYHFNDNFPEISRMRKIKWTKSRFILHSLWRNMVSLPKVLKAANNFDIIYTTSAVLDMALIPFGLKLCRKKIIWVTVFDNVVPMTDPGNKIARFSAWIFFQIAVIFLKQADVIFVSHPELTEYLLRRGFEKEKMIVTGLGLEKEMIAKAQFNPEYESDAIFVGRINETKGIYDMLKVLGQVIKKYPHFRLSIMGDGDETTKKEFKKEIARRGLRDNIRFFGFVTGQKKFDILRSSKCFWFLSVSKSESFGLSMLEAAATGLPAFCYDLPQYARIYQNNEVDISPKGDWKTVAQKVLRLFDGGNFQNERGKMLLEKYDWEKIWNREHEKLITLVKL